MVKSYGIYFSSARRYTLDDRLLKASDEGKFKVTAVNETFSFIDILPETGNSWFLAVLSLLEVVISWFIGFSKNSTAKTVKFYYKVFMIATYSSEAAFFCYLSMDDRYNFKFLCVRIVVVSVSANILYILTSKYFKHEMIFEKNLTFGILFFIGTCAVLLLHVFLYKHSSSTRKGFGVYAKLISTATGPLISLVIPLLISKYCESVLKCFHFFPSWINNIVLSISGFKKAKFEEKCVAISQSIFLEDPGFEIFCKISDKICFLRIFNDRIKWIVKCDDTCDISLVKVNKNSDTILLIENTIRLKDGHKIDLYIIFNTEIAALQCKEILDKVFGGELETVFCLSCF